MTARDSLEPLALDPSGPVDGDPGNVTSGEVALSQAISLKRIADAFDASAKLPDSAIAVATGRSIAHFINRGIVDGLTTPINHYGEGIGEAISGQFERSQR